MNIYFKWVMIIIIIVFFNMNCSLPEPDDIDPPLIAILYPHSGMTFTDSVTILIESTDDEGVTQVKCFFDDQLIGTSSSHAPRFSIGLSAYADNNIHIISASATDKAGNVGYTYPPVTIIVSDGIDRTPPIVQLLYPVADGEIPMDTIETIVNASDDENLSRIVFFIDGDSVYSINATVNTPLFTYNWDTTPYDVNSQHSLFIKAVDHAGNESYTATILVTVVESGSIEPPDVIPPTITLLYPEEEAILSDTVRVRVDVNDNVGVDSVQFFVDGELEATDIDGVPWGFDWDTGPIADSQTHTLYIKAFDESGNIGSQGPILFTINP